MNSSKKGNATIKRSRERKPKTSQIPFAIILLIMIIGFGYFLASKGAKIPIFWMFGICFGYILQRSRFCFTAGFRDIFISGSTSLTRASLIAIGLATVGFTAIKYNSVLAGGETNLAMASVTPIGVPLVIGGIMFGIGMVLAGGCASGTLMRVGEGFTMQIISLVFFIIGSVVGINHMSFWGPINANSPKIFLPDVFGWFWSLVLQLGIIVLLYIAAVKWQDKKMGTNLKGEN